MKPDATRNLSAGVDPAVFTEDSTQLTEDQIGLDKGQRRDVQRRLNGLGFDTNPRRDFTADGVGTPVDGFASLLLNGNGGAEGGAEDEQQHDQWDEPPLLLLLEEEQELFEQLPHGSRWL